MILLTIVSIWLCSQHHSPEWGFYGHRKINEIAVFSLPPELFGFYKSNIKYITDHAVDPDKRRYATKHEGVRHYIDLDKWGSYPFEDVPRNFDEAIMKYASFHFVSDKDSLEALPIKYSDSIALVLADGTPLLKSSYRAFKAYWDQEVMPQYYEEAWYMEMDSIEGYKMPTITTVSIVDHFSEHGIVPYHLWSMKRKLTQAFVDEDVSKILRFSAEIGHYIGDAHVPLHTTSNYNGQLTNQDGIHGFWESRIPELFADREYDLFIGKAEYVEDPKHYFWDIVMESHLLVDDVLQIERDVRRKLPQDLHYCFDERLDVPIRTYCPEFARAYSDAMEGMVERRMRQSILSISSIWLTCWIDAGQPILDTKIIESKNSESFTIDKKIKDTSRSHE